MWTEWCPARATRAVLRPAPAATNCGARRAVLRRAPRVAGRHRRHRRRVPRGAAAKDHTFATFCVGREAGAALHGSTPHATWLIHKYFFSNKIFDLLFLFQILALILQQ